MTTWRVDFDDILSCHQVYDMVRHPEDVVAAVKDLKEMHPEVADRNIRDYLTDAYPNQLIPAECGL